MAKQPRQMTLFPAPSDEELWTKPFTIELLNGQQVKLTLQIVRALHQMARKGLKLSPSALGAPRCTS